MSPRLMCMAVALVLSSAALQADERALHVGVETQVYPTGVIPAVFGRAPIGERSWLTFRAGYNAADRGDAGKHDEEAGGGPGVSVGYRRYLDSAERRWFVGGRADVWSLDIDWTDVAPLRQSGTTSIVVLQPTIEGGYGFRLGDGPWKLDLTVAVGWEINVDTDGEDVGEGPILLGGLQLVRRF